MFQPVLFSIIKRYNKQFFFSYLSAGVIVGIVALPLAIELIAQGIANVAAPFVGGMSGSGALAKKNVPFFFGIANKFEEAEKEIHEIPKVRIIRMKRVPFIDATGLKNLRSFINRSHKHNTQIILSGVTPKALLAIRKDGLCEVIGAENICENIEESLKRSREILDRIN